MQEAWTGADATALRIALGLTQSEFVRKSGVALGTVKKWAARGATVTLPREFAEMMDTLLIRATPEQRARYMAAKQVAMRIQLPGGGDESDAVSPYWEPGLWTADCNSIAHDLTRTDLMLDRRQATRALFGVVVGANLLEPLECWLLGPASPQVQFRSRAVGVGMQEVEQLETAARIFRDWDDQYGGGLRRKAVVGQLDEVNDLLDRPHSSEIRRRLTGVLAQLAETAATMSWDSGDQAMAQRYYVLAVRAARAAGDSPFAANALAGMARQLLCLGRSSDALELVRLAQDCAGGEATPAVRSMLDTREAWAYAQLGRPTAFHRTCDRAREMLAVAVPTEDPHWIGYFDGAELAGTVGGRLLEMAQREADFAGAAVEQIEQAIALRRPDRLRSAALDQLGMAEARLIGGEVEEACRLGHEALTTVERTASDRVRVKLLEMYDRTKPLADLHIVAEFRDRMRPLVAAPV